MFDNQNPCTAHEEVICGTIHYFISFIDGQAIQRKTEVSYHVYLEFLKFIKIERNLLRWNERHIEQSDLTDETLNKRALSPIMNLEEIAINNLQCEQLRLAIQSLPEKQRRRFTLYHIFGLTYERIAKLESCKKQSVCEAVQRAEEKIREKIKNI
jgi:RNA polymerase sigma factor (sigma-70 family)